MADLKKTPWMFLLFVLIGGLLGGILGETLKAISSEGVIRDFFLAGFDIGIHPPFTLDLNLLSASLGFTIRIDLLTLLGIILGIFIYKQA